MSVRYFKTSTALRAWFEKQHDKLSEIEIGFYKKSSGKPGISYHEALDQALCFGWIDGVRHRVDEERYKQRFTPRKAKSVWSLVNKARYAVLLKAGQITPAGQAAFERHDAGKDPSYSFENEDRPFDAELEAVFRLNQRAWKFFGEQAPWYQRASRWWVRSAKKQETRRRRLDKLMLDSQNGRRLDHLTPPSRRKK